MDAAPLTPDELPPQESAYSNTEMPAESNLGSSRATSTLEEQRLTNPLITGNSTYTIGTTGQPCE